MTSPTAETSPAFDLDLTDLEVNRDPFPHLDRLREIGPAVYNPPSRSWLVGSYRHSRQVFIDNASFAQPSELLVQLVGAPTFECFDNPRHDELRGPWNPHLTRGSVASWEERIGEAVEATLAPAFERLRAGEVVDFMPLNRTLAAHAVAPILGVPAEDYDQFTSWSNRMCKTLDAFCLPPGPDADELARDGAAATAELFDYARDYLAELRRSGKSDGLLGMLAHTSVEMSEDERCAHVVQMVFGGHDNTSKLLGATMLVLAQHPDQRQAVVEDRELVPNAIEEVLRWHGVSYMIPRIVRGSDVEIDGVAIPEGDTVSVALLAANRDPERWEEASAFDVKRRKKGHLAFVVGLHTCLGMSLARLESAIWLNKILDEIPGYELATDEIDYGHSVITRGPNALPIAL